MNLYIKCLNIYIYVCKVHKMWVMTDGIHGYRIIFEISVHRKNMLPLNYMYH